MPSAFDALLNQVPQPQTEPVARPGLAQTLATAIAASVGAGLGGNANPALASLTYMTNRADQAEQRNMEREREYQNFRLAVHQAMAEHEARMTETTHRESEAGKRMMAVERERAAGEQETTRIRGRYEAEIQQLKNKVAEINAEARKYEADKRLAGSKISAAARMGGTAASKKRGGGTQKQPSASKRNSDLKLYEEKVAGWLNAVEQAIKNPDGSNTFTYPTKDGQSVTVTLDQAIEMFKKEMSIFEGTENEGWIREKIMPTYDKLMDYLNRQEQTARAMGY